MYRILLQKKGSTIVTVIIVTAVLIILGMIMIDMTIQGLASTKRNRHIDYTDYSIQSAVEKWFSIIQSDEYKNIGMSEQPLSATDEDSLKAFAKKIVGTTPDDGLLKKKLRERPDYVSDKGIPISVLPKSLTDPDSSYDSYVKINNIYLAKEVEADDFVSEPSGGVLTLTLGFVLDGYYRDEDTKFSTLIEDVFAQKEFAFNVPIDGKFKLEAAIYSVGDLYVSSDPEGPRSEAFYNDNFNPTITGDVNIFGTSAKNILVPSQYFYGGIYALCNSKLKINGNAYTRSFIRTGTYLGSRPESAGNDGRSDKSEIHITKDAVAQCIQGFGNDNKIVVYNNAYTFDDIELNGQNSVIAINGSYIGLTGGELSDSGGNWSYTISNNHDTSSAIVNSAPLHNMLNDKSLSSRIVINGDLLVAGSTFKIDPADGTMQGEIEDASLAWDKIANLPYYKIFDWNDSGSQYTIKLREQYRAPFNNIDSFLNLFQMWSIKSSDDIESWLGEIDAVRTAQTGTNDLDNATTDLAVPDKLSGFSKYQMAANGKLYCNTFSGDTTFDFKSNNNSPSGLVYDHITKANYRIENIYDSDGNTLKYNGPSVWQGINPEDGIDSVLVSDVRFKVVKDDLIAKTHQFAQRNYPTTDSVWYTSTQFDAFNGLLSKLKGKMTTTNTYKDNVNCLYINVGDFTSSVPLDLQSLDKTGPAIPKKSTQHICPLRRKSG